MNSKNPLILKQKKVTPTEGPTISEVILALPGFDDKRDSAKIKEGNTLFTGQEIITGVFSTVSGTIEKIEYQKQNGKTQIMLHIKTADEETIDPEIQALADWKGKPPQELLDALNRANLGFPQELRTVDTVIVSAVEKEPVGSIYQTIFMENKDSLSAALDLFKQLTSAGRVILVVPQFLMQQSGDLATGDVLVVGVEPVYPNGLPEIIINKLSKKYQWKSHVFIDIEKLIAAHRAVDKGFPFVEKMVTVVTKDSEQNMMVRIGTPVKDLVDDGLQEFDKVIMGGPMMGHTVFDTNTPITESIDCIYLQKNSESIGYRNNQCMGCGNCVDVCPVYLDVNLLCRYAEFSLFDKCQEMLVQACIECGLCAYHCPSGRALVQLIQLAKSEIRKTQEGELES